MRSTQEPAPCFPDSPFTIRHVPSSIRNSQSAIRNSQSAIRNLPGSLSLAELLTGEVRALGYAVTAHPLTPMLDWAAGNGYTHAGDLSAKAGEPARVWGQVITYKRIPTKKTKEAMAFVTLEDPTGLTELVFFPKAYARFGSLITSGRPLVAEGKVESDRGGLTLTVGHAWAVRGVVVPKPVEEKLAGEGAA